MPRSSCERGVRICKRNSPADNIVSEGGGEGAQGTRVEIPAAHDECKYFPFPRGDGKRCARRLHPYIERPTAAGREKDCPP